MNYKSLSTILIAVTSFMIFHFFLCIDPIYAESGDNTKMIRVEGKGCFIYGDNDTPSSAKAKALLNAKRNAIETYKSFISSLSKLSNFELEEDVVSVLATGYLYKTKTIEMKEKEREFCVTIEAYVKPDEIDKLISEGIKSKKETSQTELTGRWEIFMQKPSKSSFSRDKNRFGKWTYSVPEINDDTYAGLNLFLNPISMKDRKVLIKLDSKKRVPIYIRFYSFTPGYSKDHDEETFIPVEAFLNRKPGYQEVLLEPSKLTVPTWWREDYKDFKVVFYPEDVRIIEFGAEVDEQLGPVADTIKINAIFLQ